MWVLGTEPKSSSRTDNALNTEPSLQPSENLRCMWYLHVSAQTLRVKGRIMCVIIIMQGGICQHGSRSKLHKEREGLIHYCGRGQSSKSAPQAPCFLAHTHLDKPLLLSMNWTQSLKDCNCFYPCSCSLALPLLPLMGTLKQTGM